MNFQQRNGTSVIQTVEFVYINICCSTSFWYTSLLILIVDNIHECLTHIIHHMAKQELVKFPSLECIYECLVFRLFLCM